MVLQICLSEDNNIYVYVDISQMENHLSAASSLLPLGHYSLTDSKANQGWTCLGLLYHFFPCVTFCLMLL
jgi:hypothetical protein